MGVPFKASLSTDIPKLAAAYNMPAVSVDGMDVLAVNRAMQEAIAHARSGEGPYFIEAMTYRYRGHSMSDPAKYRTREEVEKVRNEQDPIEQVRLRLIETKRATEDDLKKVDADVRSIVNEAAEFATHDPEPDPSELFTDVVR
jgi:pyruvate dehydrogenase E1 component alpha subunit